MHTICLNFFHPMQETSRIVREKQVKKKRRYIWKIDLSFSLQKCSNFESENFGQRSYQVFRAWKVILKILKGLHLYHHRPNQFLSVANKRYCNTHKENEWTFANILNFIISYVGPVSAVFYRISHSFKVQLLGLYVSLHNGLLRHLSVKCETDWFTFSGGPGTVGSYMHWHPVRWVSQHAHHVWRPDCETFWQKGHALH